MPAQQSGRVYIQFVARPSSASVRVHDAKKNEGDAQTDRQADRQRERDRAGFHGDKGTAVYAAKTRMRIRQRKSRGCADQLLDQREREKAEKEEKLEKEAGRQV